jgi:hypothetical protein
MFCRVVVSTDVDPAKKNETLVFRRVKITTNFQRSHNQQLSHLCQNIFFLLSNLSQCFLLHYCFFIYICTRFWWWSVNKWALLWLYTPPLFNNSFPSRHRRRYGVRWLYISLCVCPQKLLTSESLCIDIVQLVYLLLFFNHFSPIHTLCGTSFWGILVIEVWCKAVKSLCYLTSFYIRCYFLLKSRPVDCDYYVNNITIFYSVTSEAEITNICETGSYLYGNFR